MDVSSAKSLEEEKMVKDWDGLETPPPPHVPLGSGTWALPLRKARDSDRW